MAGVLVGGIIGFLGSSLRELYANWQLKKSLNAGIKSEVKVFKSFLKDGLKQIKRHEDALINHLVYDTHEEPYEFTTGFKFTFVERNIEKIGILKESTVSAIIELRSIIEAKEFIIFVDRSIKKAEKITRELKMNSDREDGALMQVMEPFKNIKATYKHLLELCDKIIFESKPTIPIPTAFH